MNEFFMLVFNFIVFIVLILLLLYNGFFDFCDSYEIFFYFGGGGDFDFNLDNWFFFFLIINMELEVFKEVFVGFKFEQFLVIIVEEFEVKLLVLGYCCKLSIFLLICYLFIVGVNFCCCDKFFFFIIVDDFMDIVVMKCVCNIFVVCKFWECKVVCLDEFEEKIEKFFVECDYWK